jgi:hypothetical protein
MFAAKLTALALLVVALIAGVSVAVPVLDAPPPSGTRAPLVVGDDPTAVPSGPRDRQDRVGGEQGRNESDDQQAGQVDPDGNDEGGDADDDETGPAGVQVIRPRPAEPADDDRDGDDDDDDTDFDESEESDD